MHTMATSTHSCLNFYVQVGTKEVPTMVAWSAYYGLATIGIWSTVELYYVALETLH